MSQAFKAAFDYVLKNEGGYVNLKADHGGATKYGVTLKTLAAWRAPKAVAASDVDALTIQEAGEIYYSRYWLKMACDRIDDDATATALFDMAVWCGVATASLYAQMAINESVQEAGNWVQVTADGAIGPATITMLNHCLGAGVFIPAYVDLLSKRCADIIEKDPTQKIFEAGWNNRVRRLLTLIPAGPTTLPAV